MGDFNLEPHDNRVGYFLNSNNLVNVVKTNNCFKGSSSCMDLILTNRKYSFRRAIMKRSKLKNKANKTKHPLDIMNYKTQRNYVTKLNKTAKLEYFNNLKLGKDNKTFREKCKP